MENKLLPIGSVVKIKEVDTLFYIAGYFPQGTPMPDHIYDYSGFPFPIGNTGKIQVHQFDRYQIDDVIVLGYQDKEQLEFMEKLKEDELKLKHLK